MNLLSEFVDEVYSYIRHQINVTYLAIVDEGITYTNIEEVAELIHQRLEKKEFFCYYNFHPNKEGHLTKYEIKITVEFIINHLLKLID